MLRTPKLRFGGDKTICQRSRSQAAVAEGRSLHGQALGWPPTPRKPETRAPGGTVPLSRLPSSCDTVLKSRSPPSSGRFCHESMATLLRRGRSSSQVQGPARVPACVTEDSRTRKDGCVNVGSLFPQTPGPPAQSHLGRRGRRLPASQGCVARARPVAQAPVPWRPVLLP